MSLIARLYGEIESKRIDDLIEALVLDWHLTPAITQHEIVTEESPTMCDCCNDREPATNTTDAARPMTSGPSAYGDPIDMTKAELDGELKHMTDSEIEEMMSLTAEVQAAQLKAKRDDMLAAECREESHAEAHDAFRFHPAAGVTGPKHDRIRGRCGYFAHWLIEICPPSDELDVALLKLREVMFWANAAVALG